MAGGHVWQGACVAGGMHSGVCVVAGCVCGGMHGRGACMAGGACMAEGACMAGGMHGRGDNVELEIQCV